MSRFEHLFPRSPKQFVVLDGGLGTTLEDIYGKDISNTPLWSTSVLLDDPESVVRAHEAFLEAGADIILTSTYQASFETFTRAGYDSSDIPSLMCKAVSLAARARNNRRTLPSALRHPCVALSLGPYGATLTPTQEFGGYYPPPYGPRVFSSSFANTNTFENVSDERISEDSLCEFHLRRLRVFAENASIWSEIDCIAFETVPLLREARAIRKAMARLRDDGFELKPWWISFVFPDGQLPDEKLTDTNGRLRPSDVVIDMFTSGDNDIPIPTAIGINCTSPQYLNALLEDMSASMKEVSKSLDLRPWLIIYPNGGKIYDIHSQSWSQPASAGDRPRWAEAVVESVRRHVGDEAWGGVVIGGCCKTRPEDIRQLAARRLDL